MLQRLLRSRRPALEDLAGRSHVLLVASLMILAPIATNAQMTPEARLKLQQQITRSRAVAVDPKEIQRPPEPRPAREPATETTETTETAETAAATAEPVLPMLPTAAYIPGIAPPAIRRVNPGELLFVPLDSRNETAAQTLLEEKITAADTRRPTALASFAGAVRQLASDDQEVQLKSYVLVGQPLQYEPEARRFVGTLLVGVADLFGVGSGPRSLTVPMQFEVLESALVDPQRLALEVTSPPYKRIRVTSRVLGEPVTLRVASNFSREGVTVTIPVEPSLIVNVDGDRLRAFGMQTARLTVRAVGGASPPQGTVTIRAPGAFLEHDQPLTFESGTAHASLRTDSPGEVIVTADATGYAPGESLPVQVIWPWPTLLAAGLGGLVGGFVRLASRVRKGMNIGQFLLGLVVSILLGIFVFALYLVGVKVLPVSFSVEVGDVFAFAAAALAGWLGVGVLPKLPSAKSKAA